MSLTSEELIALIALLIVENGIQGIWRQPASFLERHMPSESFQNFKEKCTQLQLFAYREASNPLMVDMMPLCLEIDLCVRLLS